MERTGGEPRDEYPKGREFCTTHWSVVRRACQQGSPESAGEALETLCRLYWYPLYGFARRNGCSVEDAQDSVQAFFAQFLAKNSLARADQSLGRFRSFLLVSFKNFHHSQWSRAQAVKRGGGIEFISRDAVAAEGRYALEPWERQTPDQIYEKMWAVTTLERALGRLREEYAAAGKIDWFDQLKDLLWEEKSGETYRDLARRLGSTEAAVKMAALRLRRRCRETLRETVAQTVSHLDETDQELQHLIAALRD